MLSEPEACCRSRRPSDVGLETAAASVALFPGSGTLAAATVGALGQSHIYTTTTTYYLLFTTTINYYYILYFPLQEVLPQWLQEE